MQKMIANKDFLETTEFSSNFYGTRFLYFRFHLFFCTFVYIYLFSKKAVEDVARTGRICVLDVDKQGVKNIRASDLRALFIYISPPSYEVLERRLRARKTDTESAIEKRLKESKESMEFSKQPGVYDHIVINDKLEIAYRDLKQVLQKVNKIKSFFFNLNSNDLLSRSRISMQFFDNRKQIESYVCACVCV